ncbi:MAG: undecaprenyldiphospho-muramoylpentapeptide beta-N-acetylglucosaminyltransferase, partial [Gammaproteobacteria bacterium]|nr:undecaprenyldiphospho-muramoylpentapeptide beta-N-acetylglucosaminyltransferase [Gammaproteobacteria bacterium]
MISYGLGQIDESPKKALIMAGGTGGHIYPGLALADELIARRWQISWLGSENGMERSLVDSKKYQISLISIGGIRGKGIAGWLLLPFRLFKAVKEAYKVFKKEMPDIAIGFGGFASGPGGIAALLTGTPLVLHEQNAVAGMTNRFLSAFAKKVFQAFPNAFKASKKLETIGNPVRANILNKREIKLSRSGNDNSMNIFIVGGSRGALVLNQKLPVVLQRLIKEHSINVVHQCGKDKLKETLNAYKTAGLEAAKTIDIKEFIEDMDERYLWADVIICRAGALTVSEIAAIGCCAVFVPFPYAVDDHQTHNARWLSEKDAGYCFDE